MFVWILSCMNEEIDCTVVVKDRRKPLIYLSFLLFVILLLSASTTISFEYLLLIYVVLWPKQNF